MRNQFATNILPLDQDLFKLIMRSSAALLHSANLRALNKELFASGLQTRRKVVGDAFVGRTLANGSSQFSRPGAGKSSLHGVGAGHGDAKALAIATAALSTWAC